MIVECPPTVVSFKHQTWKKKDERRNMEMIMYSLLLMVIGFIFCYQVIYVALVVPTVMHAIQLMSILCNCVLLYKDVVHVYKITKEGSKRDFTMKLWKVASENDMEGLRACMSHEYYTTELGMQAVGIAKFNGHDEISYEILAYKDALESYLSKPFVVDAGAREAVKRYKEMMI